METFICNFAVDSMPSEIYNEVARLLSTLKIGCNFGKQSKFLFYKGETGVLNGVDCFSLYGISFDKSEVFHETEGFNKAFCKFTWDYLDYADIWDEKDVLLWITSWFLGDSKYN